MMSLRFTKIPDEFKIFFLEELVANTGFYGNEILYKNLNFFNKIFVPTLPSKIS